MKQEYPSKALSVNSAGNFKAKVSDSLTIFMSRPEQGEWTSISTPVQARDAFNIIIVFTSFDNIHSVRAAFNLTQRTLDIVLEKLREIDQLAKWPSSWDFDDRSEFHVPIMKLDYGDSIERTEYFTLYWREAGEDKKFGFRDSIVHEGVTQTPHFVFGGPSNFFYERISDIAFDRTFLKTMVGYFEGYKVIAERRVSLIKNRSKCEEAFIAILQKYFKDVAFTEQVPFENRFTKAINYIDFAYEPKQIAIELDSRQYHDPTVISSNSWEYQIKRDRALKLSGWTVLRFTCKEIFTSPEQVAYDIQQAMSH